MHTAVQLAIVATLAFNVAATTITIDVGKSGLAFDPDTVTASVGDILEFHYFPINHSVVMGDFSDPCKPASAGGFFSGFMPVGTGEGSEVFQVTVNSTDSMVFYCSQTVGGHCQSGMAGVVNPSGNNTLAAYQSAAKSVALSSNPPAPFGGLLVNNAASTTSASPACTTTTSSGNSGSGYRKRQNNGCTTSSNSGAATLRLSFGGILAASGLAIFML